MRNVGRCKNQRILYLLISRDPQRRIAAVVCRYVVQVNPVVLAHGVLRAEMEADDSQDIQADQAEGDYPLQMSKLNPLDLYLRI